MKARASSSLLTHLFADCDRRPLLTQLMTYILTIGSVTGALGAIAPAVKSLR